MNGAQCSMYTHLRQLRMGLADAAQPSVAADGPAVATIAVLC